MHFSGCQLCSGRTDPHYADAAECRVAMGEALSHAGARLLLRSADTF